MPFATSTRSLGARAVPLATAAALSFTIYATHSFSHPARNDDTPVETTVLHANAKAGSVPTVKGKILLSGASAPLTPLGWGSNTYLTVLPDVARKTIKRPTAMSQLGATPYRDLAIHEKYGAVIDARGDLWMWGAGYDPEGEVGRSLRGKRLRKLAPGPGKLFSLSKDGRLYVVSADRAFQDAHKKSRSWWKKLVIRDPIVDFVELHAKALNWGEHFAGVAVGQHHLLAVTNHGRTFSLPLSPAANTHRQLGTKQTFPVADTPKEALAQSPDLPPASDPRFATTLTEIPALSGIQIAEVAASERSSFVRTTEGRVLGFGANDYGQIGLGPTTTVSTVPTPVEISLGKAYPNGASVRCTGITAGGQTTLFTVESTLPGASTTLVDVLSCGNGQNGSLGSGMWSSASYAPARIKAISSLQEYSEKEGKTIPIGIYSLSMSPSPMCHAFAVLDTVRNADAKGAGEGLFGKDVLVWGGNSDYQLGTGKRSAQATPQHLASVIPHAIDTLVADIGTEEVEGSPIPVTRLQLHTGKADAYDPMGKLIKRGVKVEETLVAGYNCSVLYSKIVS